MVLNADIQRNTRANQPVRSHTTVDFVWRYVTLYKLNSVNHSEEEMTGLIQLQVGRVIKIISFTVHIKQTPRPKKKLKEREQWPLFKQCSRVRDKIFYKTFIHAYANSLRLYKQEHPATFSRLRRHDSCLYKS